MSSPILFALSLRSESTMLMYTGKFVRSQSTLLLLIVISLRYVQPWIKGFVTGPISVENLYVLFVQFPEPRGSVTFTLHQL